MEGPLTRAGIHERAATKLDEIEAELRRLGWWEIPEPPPEAFRFRQAFALDTMAFQQWLRFVFAPRVRELVAGEAEMPTSSMVAAQAARELDGHPDAGRLFDLLIEFDQLFDRES